MKIKFVALAPYIIVLGIDFYLLPLLMKDTGAAMVLMLCVMPLIAFVLALIYGIHNGFSFLLPIAAFLLFVPSVLVFYNSSAWVYAIVYAAVVLAGMGIGRLFYNKR